MKHKVSELEGELLDAAVAKANGWTEWKEQGKYFGLPVWLTSDDDSPTRSMFQPSQKWGDGGPIIERERMHVSPEFRGGNYYGQWRAIVFGFEDQGDRAEETGDTPLIAAMRAYVASKFGDDVALP